MNKKIIYFGIFSIFFSFVFYSFFSKQNYKQLSQNEVQGSVDFSSQPPPTTIPSDLLTGTRQFLDFISNTNNFKYDNCAASLNSIYTDLERINPEHFNQTTVKNNLNEIIKNLYLSRYQLRVRLKEFVDTKLIQGWKIPEDNCVTQMRNVIRAARYLEDYLGEAFMGISPFNAEKDPLFFGTFKKSDEPWLLKSPGVETIKLRSGDMIMSRGNAYTSAAIARIGVIDSQFSHMAFVYIDGDSSGKEYTIEEISNNPKAFALEAHIEVGSTIRPISTYFKDGNARNVLFRYPDAQVAHQAAKFSYDKIVAYNNKSYNDYKRSVKRVLNVFSINLPKQHPNFNIPYDFKMDTSESNTVFCSEMVSMGFNNPQINMKLPMFESALPTEKENDLVKALGIKVKQTYAPGDTELDPRFEMLAEWRDYRKVRGLRYKDAISVSMFDWMKKYNYKFDISFILNIGAKLVWSARWVDLPRIDVDSKVIFDVTEKLPKNMTTKIAGTVTTLNNISELLEKRIEADEKEYIKNHPGLLLPYSEMLASLERYRQEDYKKLTQKQKTDFHKMLHPAND